MGVAPANGRDIDAMLGDLAGPGLDLDGAHAVALTCGARRYMFVPTTPDPINRARPVPATALVGIVASFESAELGRWLPAYYVIVDGRDDAKRSQVQVRSPAGIVVYAGVIDRDDGSFQLAAELRPGAAPVDIAGTFADGILTVTVARVGSRHHPALVAAPLR